MISIVESTRDGVPDQVLGEVADLASGLRAIAELSRDSKWWFHVAVDGVNVAVAHRGRLLQPVMN